MLSKSFTLLFVFLAYGFHCAHGRKFYNRLPTRPGAIVTNSEEVLSTASEVINTKSSKTKAFSVSDNEATLSTQLASTDVTKATDNGDQQIPLSTKSDDQQSSVSADPSDRQSFGSEKQSSDRTEKSDKQSPASTKGTQQQSSSSTEESQSLKTTQSSEGKLIFAKKSQTSTVVKGAIQKFTTKLVKVNTKDENEETQLIPQSTLKPSNNKPISTTENPKEIFKSKSTVKSVADILTSENTPEESATEQKSGNRNPQIEPSSSSVEKTKDGDENGQKEKILLQSNSAGNQRIVNSKNALSVNATQSDTDISRTTTVITKSTSSEDEETTDESNSWTKQAQDKWKSTTNVKSSNAVTKLKKVLTDNIETEAVLKSKKKEKKTNSVVHLNQTSNEWESKNETKKMKKNNHESSTLSPTKNQIKNSQVTKNSIVPSTTTGKSIEASTEITKSTISDKITTIENKSSSDHSSSKIAKSTQQSVTNDDETESTKISVPTKPTLSSLVTKQKPSVTLPKRRIVQTLN